MVSDGTFVEYAKITDKPIKHVDNISSLPWVLIEDESYFCSDKPYTVKDADGYKIFYDETYDKQAPEINKAKLIVEAVNNHRRLQDENQRLKYDLDNARQDIEEGNALIRQLSEENERLVEENQTRRFVFISTKKALPEINRTVLLKCDYGVGKTWDVGVYQGRDAGGAHQWLITKNCEIDHKNIIGWSYIGEIEGEG